MERKDVRVDVDDELDGVLEIDGISVVGLCWVVLQNTDLTEGRGVERVIECCELRETAERLSKGKGVQGANARVAAAPLLSVFSTPQGLTPWVSPYRYGPVSLVRPSDEDKREEKRKKAVRAAEERARDAGLSDEDIAALKYGI